MAGAYFAYRNLFQPENYEVVVGLDTTEDSNFPLSNLYERQLSSVGRVTSPSVPSIVFNALASHYECNLIAFIGENAPIEIYVNGVTSYTQTYFESPEMLEVLPKISIFCIPPTNIETIEATLIGATAPGPYELGRVYMARAINLPLGVDARWSIGFKDSGNLENSEGQQFYENRGVRTRRLSFTCNVLTERQAYGIASGNISAYDEASFQAMQYYAGETSEVIIVPRSTTALDIRRLAIYGHLENAFSLNHDSGIYYSCSLAALEER